MLGIRKILVWSWSNFKFIRVEATYSYTKLCMCLSSPGTMILLQFYVEFISFFSVISFLLALGK